MFGDTKLTQEYSIRLERNSGHYPHLKHAPHFGAASDETGRKILPLKTESARGLSFRKAGERQQTREGIALYALGLPLRAQVCLLPFLCSTRRLLEGACTQVVRNFSILPLPRGMSYVDDITPPQARPPKNWSPKVSGENKEEKSRSEKSVLGLMADITGRRDGQESSRNRGSHR